MMDAKTAERGKRVTRLTQGRRKRERERERERGGKE